MGEAMKLSIAKEGHQEYFDIKALSNTGIKYLLDNPALFKAWWDGEIKEKNTDALRFGDLLHCLTLEPEQFWSRYLIGSGKDNKAIQTGAKGKSLIPAKKTDYDVACAMSAAIKKLPLWQHLDNRHAKKELVIQWEERVNGMTIPCKGKIDLLGPLNSRTWIPLDVKSTRSANPASFAKDILRYGYHTQASWYIRGLLANGYDVNKFILLPIEKEPPHAALLVELSPEMLNRGWLQCETALTIFARCASQNRWPGYGNDEIIII